MRNVRWVFVMLVALTASQGAYAGTTAKAHSSTRSCPLAQGRAIDQGKVLSETNSKNKQEADGVKTQSAK